MHHSCSDAHCDALLRRPTLQEAEIWTDWLDQLHEADPAGRPALGRSLREGMPLGQPYAALMDALLAAGIMPALEAIMRMDFRCDP